MTDRKSPQVFVCCSGRRGPVVAAVLDSILARLEAEGVSAWAEARDGRNLPDEERRAAIARVIRSSAVCVAVLDGRRTRTPADDEWQIHEAIASHIPVLPLGLPNPAEAPRDGGDWLDDLDAVLDDRLETLVWKVRVLLDDAEAEVGGRSGRGLPPGGENDVAPFGDAWSAEEEREVFGESKFESGADSAFESAGESADAFEDDGQRDAAVERSGEDGDAGQEEEDKSAGSAAPAPDGEEGRAKVTFPLPPPKVGMRGYSGRKPIGPGDDGKREEADADALRRGGRKLRETGAASLLSDDAKANGEDEPSPRGMREAAPLLAAALGLVAILIGIQALSSRDTRTTGQRNMAALESLGYSLNMHAAAHGGRFPDSLDELVDQKNDSTALRWRDEEAGAAEDFVYYPGYTWASSPAAVLAASPRPTKDGRRAVLYLNADVRLMREPVYQKRLEGGTIGPGTAEN